MKDSMGLLAGPFFAGDTLPFVSFGSIFGIDETNSFTLGEEARWETASGAFVILRPCPLRHLTISGASDRSSLILVLPRRIVRLCDSRRRAFRCRAGAADCGLLLQGLCGPLTPKPSLEVPGEPTRTMRFSKCTQAGLVHPRRVGATGRGGQAREEGGGRGILACHGHHGLLHSGERGACRLEAPHVKVLNYEV